METEKFDKEQERVDNIRKSHKKSIGNDAHKHEILESVMGVLKDNDIRCYVYAQLPSPDYSKDFPSIYQFNTLGALMEKDSEGNWTKQSRINSSHFHEALWTSLYQTITLHDPRSPVRDLDISDPKEFNKQMNYFASYVYQCLINNSKLPKDVEY